MKNKFDDITPPEKRSIRNIPLPARSQGQPSMDGIRPAASRGTVHHAPQADIKPVKKVQKAAPKPAPKPVAVERTEEEVFEDDETQRKSRWKFWTFLVVVILVGGYFLSAYFAHADINLTLAKHDMTLTNKSIPLDKIKYTVVSSDITKSATVQANGFQKVSKNATGSVVIYNSANTKSQALTINTRLETADGHIFKTDSAVTIPAITMSGDKKIAGSVTVNVTAEKPGEEYNLGLKDFTIPGFKGTDNYTILYARSKTPLAGGFIGNMPNISEADLAKASASLKAEITAEVDKNVVAKVKEDTKEDFEYIPDALVVDYAPAAVKQSADGKSANMTITAKATAMAVSNSSLAGYLVESDDMPQTEPESPAKEGTGKYDGDFSKTKLSLPSNVTAKALALSANQTNPGITVTANGTASIASGIDEEAIKSAVSRLSREQAIEIIKNIVDFNVIEVSLKPWWTTNLPSASKIRINIEK